MPISLTKTTYTQDFNGLASTGTSSTLPANFTITEAGANANATYTAGTGSSNSGDTYSFGAAGGADRALGGLRSGPLNPTIGASFTNDTGETITALQIGYTGEQYRLGTAGRADRLDFQYSLDGTTWIDANALDFSSPVTSGATGMLDGNLAANRTLVSGEIGGLNIPAGATFFIRWLDADASGADDGLAIDDFSLTPVTSIPTPSLSVGDVTLNEGQNGTTNATFTITLSSAATSTVTVNYSTADGTALAGSDYIANTGTLTFAPGETTKQVSVAIAGDLTIEETESFVVNLTSPTNATIADAQATGTITNDDFPAVQPGVLSIGNATVAEGNSGTTDIVFTVTRASGSDGAVSATWTFTANTATAADFSGALSGSVNLAAGQTSATITLNVIGDLVTEPNETFDVVLSAPVGGATLADASGLGTITNDDVPPLNTAVFINELHYDDAGADANEGIEIAGPAGTDLSGYSLVLYNGTNTPAAAPSYNTRLLSGVIGDQDDGYGTVSFIYPVNGLQNGPNDGIALVDPFGRIVQFLSYGGPLTAANGPAAGLTSQDIGVSETGVPDGFSLQLVGDGASYDDFTWATAKQNTFGGINSGQNFIGADETGLVRIGDARVTEGNAGEQAITFTVRRAGGLAEAASVDWMLNLTAGAGSADLADFKSGQPLTGNVSFAPGVASTTITLIVTGDTIGERNETFNITLANPLGDIAIVDGTAVGTILNDDVIQARIFEIQGEAHRSPLEGQPVVTTGIVTFVTSNGFYLQDATGDANAATSDAVFVFTGPAPAVPVAVGDGVQVSGRVSEFLPGGDAINLTTTQIESTGVLVTSNDNPLPAAVIIGEGGVLPPTATIDDDQFAVFDPQNDGIDFYESLEGMRVTVDAPVAVAETNSFGETFVVASGGVGATGFNDRSGIVISEGDFNPERIQIDDTFFRYPALSQGDRLADVTGVISYGFASYELLLTEAAVVTQDVTLDRETTELDGDRDHLTVANYNVENLDPTDAQTKFDILAADIVFNLSAPDIIAVQEIQDADGAGSGSNLSGQATADKLIAAIEAAGGPSYIYIEIAPAANSSGGEPGGNIRNGYFYNPDRVALVEGSLAVIDDPAYNGTRKPLVATFDFNGEQVTLINVHFTSRGGSDPLFGSEQPPADAGDGARTAQAAAVAAYIEDRLATDPALKLGVIGDFNGFYFEPVSDTIEAEGLTNLHELNPLEERYTYLFEGNYQALDNFLVTGGLLGGAGDTQYDAVHINAEQPDTPGRATDHDPSVARFFIEAPNEAPVAADDAIRVNEDASSGNLWDLLLGNDNDIDAEDILSIKSVDGTGTLGSLRFDAESKTLVYVADDDSFDALAPGATAIDRFTYTVTDDDGLTSTATVEVTVTGIDDTLRIDGGNGNDRVTGAGGEDVLLGGNGNDTVLGEGGLDFLDGGNGNDQLFGGSGGDRLFGGTGNDLLFGEDGNDRLDGGIGNDRLTGGAGNDRFAGGIGNDVFEGGAGADLFLVEDRAGNDLIADFDIALDRLVLADGVTIRRTTVRDFDGDGIADLRLTFSKGGELTLLGVGDPNDVQYASNADFML